MGTSIGFIEATETARDAMTQPAVYVSVSSYKSMNKKTMKKIYYTPTYYVKNKYVECSA